MKITRSKLTQIIKEELTNISKIKASTNKLKEIGAYDPRGGGEEPPAGVTTGGPGEKKVQREFRDVDLLTQFLPRINQAGEFSELLIAVLEHGVSGRVPNFLKAIEASAQGDKNLYYALLKHMKAMKSGKIGGGEEVEPVSRASGKNLEGEPFDADVQAQAQQAMEGKRKKK